ncbi:MAG: hypothetical protein LBV02_07860 [Bacteroidales bacterium]|jgi:hypothetical protein|nr:hypothetical protein [Bacteroidales bacterium]
MSRFLAWVKEYFPFISAILAVIALIILIISAHSSSEASEDEFVFGFSLQRTSLKYSYETPIPLGKNQLELSVYTLSLKDIDYFKNPEASLHMFPIHGKRYGKDWDIFHWHAPTGDSLSMKWWLPALSPTSLRSGIEQDTKETIAAYFNYAKKSLEKNGLIAGFHHRNNSGKEDFLLYVLNLEDGVLIRVKRGSIH